MIKNAPGQSIALQAIIRADGNDGVGLTPVVTITKDGGTPAVGLGAITEKSFGAYAYAPTQAETNADHILFQLTEATIITQALNVYPNTVQSVVDDNKTEIAKVIKSGETGRHVQGTVHSNSDVEVAVTRV